jgi:hypothetical protein
MRKNIKIMVNSYPRSGTSTFVNAIRASLRGSRRMDMDELFQNDTWVIKGNVPGILLGTYPEDVKIITMLRDPLDAVASNCFRWSNGHTGNIVQGRIVVDNGQVRNDQHLDGELKELIDHQILQYLSYMHCYLENHENIIAVRYEDMHVNIEKCLEQVFPGEYSLDYEGAEEAVRNPNLPSEEKTDRYYAIKQYIVQSDIYKEAVRAYIRALSV